MTISYEQYLATDWWRSRCTAFRGKIKNRCWICHVGDPIHLAVHHKRLVYRSGMSVLFREQDSDLRILCVRCRSALMRMNLLDLFARDKVSRIFLRDLIRSDYPMIYDPKP